jgi:hypothetical protein
MAKQISLNQKSALELGVDVVSSPYRPTELGEQQAYFSWLKNLHAQYPLLKLMFHPVNEGKRLGSGLAQKLAGMVRGVPDIVCLGYRFAIEFKVFPNAPSPYQSWWIRELIAIHWRVGLCYSLEEAMSFTFNAIKPIAQNSQTMCESRALQWLDFVGQDYVLDPFSENPLKRGW